MMKNSEIDILEQKREAAKAIAQNPYLVIRELNNRSLYHFFKWAWPIVNNQPLIENWHIKYLCQQLELIAERVGNRQPCLYDLIINIIPGSTKTMLCSVIFPVWCWTKWPWMQFITASYAIELSLESAEKSRDIIKSDEFRKVYPEYLIKPDKDNKSNYKIAVMKKTINGTYINPATGKPSLEIGGNRLSASVGGRLTGFHGDILIWDDPLNPEKAASDKEIENANRWMARTLPTRKTSQANSATIGIMQRLHEEDPTGHMLKKKGINIKHVCLPGELYSGYDKYVNPPGLKKYYHNGLFDKRRFTPKDLKKLEIKLGPYGYAGQIGQRPTPAGGGAFKVENFNIVTTVPAWDIVKIVRFWDKAATAGGGAYSCGVKMALLKNGRYCILNVRRGQWSSDKREQIIRQTAETDGEHVYIYVEQEPGSGGKESAESTIRNLAGFMIYADRPTGNKELRADPFSVQVNSGNVDLLHGEWNQAYIDELELFPNSRYKDQVDASSGAFNKLIGRKEVEVIT